MRTYTEPQQYFWNSASDAGSYFYQSFGANPSVSLGGAGGTAGFFTPGSLTLPYTIDSRPANGYAKCPGDYQQTAMSDFAFAACSLGYLGYPTAIDPKIKQPYTQSWNFGIQRELSKNNVIEIRYSGNRSEQQWLPMNINEVNINQSGAYGVLTNFTAAQQNLAAYVQANPTCGPAPQPPCSFANNGLAGQQGTPLFDAAFAGESAGADGKLFDYTNGTFVQYLNHGQVGNFGNALTNNNGTTTYFCNLVGASFGPCASNVGYVGPGAGLPINFLQANPYASGTPLYYTTDKGYSTYNALQVDFRQKQFHGMQFDANYTWSHALGTTAVNDWLGYGNQFTVRNTHLGYGPGLDIRQVLHVNGTYDLPIGKGKQFANRGGVVDRVVGGWSLGTILTYQTGTPFLLRGGYNTFNDYGDGGINLTGVSLAQLQSSVGVRHVAGFNKVQIIDPKYLNDPHGGANKAYINPNTTPGTIGKIGYLYGPRSFQTDLALTKSIAITEGIRFKFQGEFLNAFNHPVFGLTGSKSVQSSTFGVLGSTVGSARRIELRANIEF
jgi:hypothetical protein